MSFPISPSNGEITVVNGITYIYNLSEGSWTRSTAPVGDFAATGNVTANKFYTTNGLFWSGNGVAFASGGGSDATLQANVGAYQLYANANIGTLFLGNASTQANLGAFQLYSNSNAAAQATSIDTINANIGAFYSYANANIGTLFLGNTSTQANLGAFQTFSNANAAGQQTSIDNINANIGAFYSYANANIGTLFLGNTSTQANIGAFYNYANANIGTIRTNLDTLDANVGAYEIWSNANAAAQATSLNTINANIGAFYTYANTKIGTNTNSNLVVQSTTDSTSAVTGALVVAGGIGVGGNLYVAGNIFASNLVSINTNTISVNDPLLYLNADTPFPYNYDIGFFSHFVGGSLTRYQHSGFARNVNDSTWTLFSNVFAEPGATISWSEANIIYDPIKVGSATIANTTASTNTTTGALVVAGGVGIAGALYIANTGDVSANISTLFLGNASTQANLGAYQLYANANAAAQATSLDTINANIGAFYTYANTKIGTNSNGNLVVGANLDVGSNVNVTGNVYANRLYTTAGLYWSGNGTAFSSGGGSTPGGSDTQVQFNDGGSALGGDSTFSFNKTSKILSVQQVLVTNSSGDEGGEILLAKAATNTTISGTGVTIDIYQNRLRFFEQGGSARGYYLDITSGGAGVSTNIISGGGGGGTPAGSTGDIQFNNGGAFGATSLFYDAASGNIVLTDTTDSVSTTTGAMVIKGGVGVAGNVVSDKLYTSNGIYWAGNKAAVGAAFTTSSSAPANPAVGSFWYKSTTDVLYEYISDGTGTYWVDISTQTIAATTAGEGIAGNVSIAGNVLITGTITGSVGYLLERANIVASAPPAVTNLDLISASILYFTSNSTANITANIRGNATTTLNSMLAVGQSSTFVIFMPNATAYYVNTIKIDNTTVTPFWQGGSTITNGNANSLDIYTFAVLKTADATFKVFASQVRYQNLGP